MFALTWSEVQSGVIFHDITAIPTSLTSYSNEKHLPQDMAVSTTSLELSIH
jgi:hypothetical protein